MKIRTIINTIIYGVLVAIAGCSQSSIDLQPDPDSEAGANTASEQKYFKKSLKLIKMIETETDALLPLAQKLPPAKTGEWRTFWREEEQSPQKYVLSMPSIVTDQLTTLYIRPLGDFSYQDRQILTKIVEFMKINFQTPVILLENTRVDFPPEAVKVNKRGDKQYSSIYTTDVLLKKEIPDDAWGILAVTPNDIFRAEALDKHYGDALRYGRRGVISLYHLKKNGKTSLSMALKGASHEATHLLSLPHCVKYRCNMNGRITLEEFDAAPLWYSPDCLCKIIFATGGDIKTRFAELMEYSRKNGLNRELDYYTRAYNIVGGY